MSKIIDLTYDIYEGMLTTPVPWHPVVEISQLGRHNLEGRATSKFILGSHTIPAHIFMPLVILFQMEKKLMKYHLKF